MTSDSEKIEESFVLVDGVRIHYLRAGTGPALMLIHGLVGSSRNWRRNMSALSRHATVYAVDLLNMGESERVPGIDASLKAIADRVAAMMSVLGLAQADVAGHSHGGAVAMMLAARYPRRVRKLVLFAPANPFCNLGRQLIRFYRTRPGYWLASLVPSLPRFLKVTALGRMYGDPARITDDAIGGYTDGLATPGTVEYILGIVHRWYADMNVLHSALAGLVDQPTLLIWGDRDRAVGLSSAGQLQQFLKQSQLLIIPGAGHIAFEEMPEVCNRAMSDWLLAPLAEVPSFAMRYPSESLRRLRAV